MFTSCDVAVRSSLMVLAVWSVVVSVTAEGCLHCKQKPPRSSSGKDYVSSDEKGLLTQEKAAKEELLDEIEAAVVHCDMPFHSVNVDIPTEAYDSIVEKMDLVIRVLGGYFPQHDQKMLRTFIEETVLSDEYTPSGRLLWVGNGSLQQPDYYVSVEDNSNSDSERKLKNIELEDFSVDDSIPWMMVSGLEPGLVKDDSFSYQDTRLEDNEPNGNWTEPYFDCKRKKWIISYTSLIFARSSHMRQKRQDQGRIVGIMSIDVDGTDIDINQCDTLLATENITELQMSAFLGTHKCDNHTSQCIFTPGYGWARGSYKCQCRDGFYSATGNPLFNGSLVESAFKDKITLNSPTYDMLYICKPCQPGCDTCIDDSPCLSNYNWAFRISLLTISIICILLTMVLSVYVYRYRKVKVIKVASPIFLCITLLGCVIMYCEMAAIFPVLDMYSCVATKWTRHMGFCITYSALLLKTWRVSLTYRVKSAHKLKLTDKQLLQWLFPILLVMAVYLGTWTISSPPVAVYIQDWYKLKFKQCDYNWWDHSLAIGEFLFLLWGIRVCYNVRNAESFFNEAKHISWAVHSITIVNIIMVMIHLVILPSSGPDIKYLFGFFRTQLSTTITVILIFGPKFYRVIKGQGDAWDNRARARGVTASFSLNGVGPVYEEPQDLYQENEELKEEVQKLASQIEFMRIVHMEINNRHLKPKHGGFFSQPTANQSPVMKNIYMKFDSTDSPGSRISPAAELVSEKV